MSTVVQRKFYIIGIEPSGTKWQGIVRQGATHEEAANNPAEDLPPRDTVREAYKDVAQVLLGFEERRGSIFVEPSTFDSRHPALEALRNSFQGVFPES